MAPPGALDWNGLEAIFPALNAAAILINYKIMLNCNVLLNSRSSEMHLSTKDVKCNPTMQIYPITQVKLYAAEKKIVLFLSIYKDLNKKCTKLLTFSNFEKKNLLVSSTSFCTCSSNHF